MNIKCFSHEGRKKKEKRDKDVENTDWKHTDIDQIHQSQRGKKQQEV